MAFVEISIGASSNIASVSYDVETKTLRILFWRDNRTYAFFDVPSNVAEGFRTSGLSAGKFFRSSIMNRYGYEEES